jgi:hypothetical protein
MVPYQHRTVLRSGPAESLAPSQLSAAGSLQYRVLSDVLYCPVLYQVEDCQILHATIQSLRISGLMRQHCGILWRSLCRLGVILQDLDPSLGLARRYLRDSGVACFSRRCADREVAVSCACPRGGTVWRWHPQLSLVGGGVAWSSWP